MQVKYISIPIPIECVFFLFRLFISCWTAIDADTRAFKQSKKKTKQEWKNSDDDDERRKYTHVSGLDDCPHFYVCTQHELS